MRRMRGLFAGLMTLAVVAAAQPVAAVPIPDVTNSGDAIIPIDMFGTISSSPGGEAAPNAIDNNNNTKYLNFGEEFSGFIVTPSNNPLTHAVRSISITTANDAVERDPTSFMIWGTNAPITSAAHSNGSAEAWTFIAQGTLAPPDTRFADSPVVAFANNTHYNSYRVVFPTTKNTSANSMQLAEVRLDADDISTPGPAFQPIPDVTFPTDFIIPIDRNGGSSSPGGEQAPLAIDNNPNTKYLNFGKENSGFIVTPSLNPLNYAVTSLTITTANDAVERDPTSFELWGTNAPITSTAHSTGESELWTLIASGGLNLPDARFTVGPTVNFANNIHFNSFKLIFPTLKNAGATDSMQIGEVQLDASVIVAGQVPEPATAMLGILGAAGLAFRRRRVA